MVTVTQWRPQATTDTRTAASPTAIFWTAVGLAMLLGAIPRLLPALSSDFPLNDGGMFLLMARELRENSYVLPAYTAYNNAGIPFAYPPLGFYLAALISSGTGAALFDIVRLLPPLITMLTIPTFALFARAVARTPTQAIIATFAFAMLPRSFMWLIMGGGLTRAPGALFAILTLWLVYLLYTRGDRHLVPPTILCAALTVLSHAEWAWFTAYSAALFCLFLGRNRRGIINSLLVGVGVVALTAPWWATVLTWHGAAPLLAAARSGSERWFALAYVLIFKFTSEPLLPILAVLGLIGLFACLAERQFFLPAWLLTILLIQPRSAPTLACLPLALLIGVTIDEVILPALSNLSQARQYPMPTLMVRRAGWIPSRTAQLFIAYCALYALVNAIATPYSTTSLQTLPREEREAMSWIAANTAQDSTFLVLSREGAEKGWEQDRASEWFPVLAQRSSLGTVQGSEWLTAGQFARHKERFGALQACADADIDCILSWLAEEAPPSAYIYLTASQQGSQTKNLVAALRATDHYTQIYSRSGVLIFQYRASN